MSKKKARKKSWQQRVVDLVRERKIFDIAEDNNGFTKVTEMIAWALLDGKSNRDKLLEFHILLPIIENVFHAALHQLEDEGTPVRRNVPEGKRNIVCISLLASQPYHVREHDTRRTLFQMKTICLSKMIHLKLSDPAALPQAKAILRLPAVDEHLQEARP